MSETPGNYKTTRKPKATVTDAVALAIRAEVARQVKPALTADERKHIKRRVTEAAREFAGKPSTINFSMLVAAMLHHQNPAKITYAQALDVATVIDYVAAFEKKGVKI